MAVSVGAKVNTPFGSGVVCNKRKDGGVDVVGFAFFFIRTIFFFTSRGNAHTSPFRSNSLWIGN